MKINIKKLFPLVLITSILSGYTYCMEIMETKVPSLKLIEVRGNSVALSPSKEHILIGTVFREVYLYTKEGVLLKEFKGHRNFVRALAFSPDETKIITGSEDGTARVWDVETGKELHKFEYQGHVNSVAFSPNGEMVAVGTYKKIDLLSVKTGKLIKELTANIAHVWVVVFSPDGTKLLGSGQDVVFLWDINREVVLQKITGPEAFAMSAVFSTDGTAILIGSFYGWICLWDIETGNVQGLSDYPTVRSVALSAGKDKALIGFGDGTVRLWDIKARKVQDLTPRSIGRMYAVAFRSEEEIIAVKLSPTADTLKFSATKVTAPSYDANITTKYLPIKSFTEGVNLSNDEQECSIQ